jgi:phage tail protein X
MDNVKIKRVKRNRKKPTAKEKILAGLGVGGALMGGISAVAPQQQRQEILSKNTSNQSSAGSKIKSALKNIFGSTLGVTKAEAAGEATVTSDISSDPTVPKVGDVWHITVTGTANQTVSVSANGSTTPMGTIGNNGKFELSGKFSTNDLVNSAPTKWDETWTVDGVFAGTVSFTLNPSVAAAPITLVNTILTGAIGQTPTAKLSARGGAGGPYTFVGVSGAFPPGVDLNSDGSFSGTITAGSLSSYNFTVAVTDTASGKTVNLTAHMDVSSTAAAVTPTVTSDIPANPKVRDPWNITVTGTPTKTVTATANGSTTPMGTIGDDGQLKLSGHFSQADLDAGTPVVDPNTGAKGGQWKESWSVGGVSAGTVSFTIYPAAATPTPSSTVNTSGLVLSPNPASPGNFQGSVLINGQQVTVAVVNGVVYGPDGKIAGTPGSVLAGLTAEDTTQIVNAFNNPATINAAGNLTATITSTTDPTSGVTTYTIKIPGTNISFSATSISGVGGLNSQMQIYNTSDAGAQRVFAALAQASNNYIARQNAAGHPVGGTGTTATGANGSPYDLTSFVFPPYTESPGVQTQEAINALLAQGGNVTAMVAARNADTGAYNLYLSQLFDDYNYEQGYNNWLISINAGRTAPLPTKPDGFDARQQGQHTTAWTGGGVANNGVPGSATAQTLTATGGTSLTFINNTTGNISQLKVGDQWTITVTGPAGSPVYATDSKGNKTLMGTISGTSGTGTLVLGGKVTGDQVGQWTESWTVGSVALPGTVAFNVVVAGSATPTLTFGNTNGGGTAFKVGDSWTINLSGVNVPDGTPVYAIGGVVDSSGKVNSGQIQLGVIYNGVFQQTTALDLTDAGKWQVSIFVGTGTDQKQIGATQNFTVSDYAVTAITVPATSSGTTYKATISATDSSGNFTVTLNDSNQTKITASSLADLDSQMQKYAGTPSSQNAENQKILASFSAALYAIRTQNTPAAPVVGNPNPIISTSGASTLTFSNDLGGSGYSLGVGNSWVVNVQGAAINAPVYAYGGVVGGAQGWIYLGTTDANGNLNVPGPVLGTGDIGKWNVQIQVGAANTGTAFSSLKSGDAVKAPTGVTKVGSDLSFSVGTSQVTTQGVYTPTFQQNVQGSGPYGSYSLNPAYYATQGTADWLAAHYGGTVITVNTTANWGMFHYPDQLFIQFPDGTAVNAGQLAMAYNNGAGNVDSYTGLLENDEQALAFIRSEKTSHPGTSGVAGGDYGTTDNPEIRNGPTIGNVATSVRFVNKTAGNVNTLAVDDQWEITVTGPNGMNVYVTGGKNGANDTTPKGTITNGTLVLDGKIASGDIGTWLETWRIGANPAQATTIGSFGFTAIATRTTTTGTTGTGTGGTTTASQSPVISSISSASVTPGGILTIIGSNFSATASGNVVDFISGNNIIQASIASASSTNLAVTVPSNLSLGAVYIVRVSPAADPTKVSNTFFVLASAGGGTTGGSTATATPSIISTTLPDATVGVAYGQRVLTSNLSTTAVWSAYGLPAGLTINSSTGIIFGTPTAATTSSGAIVTVTVVSDGNTITQRIILNVRAVAATSGANLSVTAQSVSLTLSQPASVATTVSGNLSNKNVTAVSSNPNIALPTVDSNGVVTINGVSAGTAVVTIHLAAAGTDTSQDKTILVIVVGTTGSTTGPTATTVSQTFTPAVIFPPSLSSFAPGANVVLPGNNFNQTAGNNIVIFYQNGQSVGYALASAVTPTSLTFTAPTLPAGSYQLLVNNSLAVTLPSNSLNISIVASSNQAAISGSLLTIDQLNSSGLLTTDQVQTTGNTSGLLTLNDLAGGGTSTGTTTAGTTSGTTTTADDSVEATTDTGTTTGGSAAKIITSGLTLDQLQQTGTTAGTTTGTTDTVESSVDTGVTNTGATSGSLTLDQLQQTGTGTTSTTTADDSVESTTDTGATTGNLTLDQLGSSTATGSTTTGGLTLDQLQQTGTTAGTTTGTTDTVESSVDTGVTNTGATSGSLTLDQLQQTGTGTTSTTTANDSVESTTDTGATTDEIEATDTAAADDSVETSEAGATTTAGSLTLDQLQNTTGTTNDTVEATTDTGTTTSGLTLDQLGQTTTGTTSTTTADDSVESTTDAGITTGNGSVATASGLTLDQLQQTGTTAGTTTGTTDTVEATTDAGATSGLTMDQLQQTDTSTTTATAGAAISGITPYFLTISPQVGYVGQVYNSAIVAVSNYPTTYTVIAGVLPSGLTMSSSGVITGIPTTMGTNSFTVQATTSQNVSSSKQFTLTVNSQQNTGISTQTGSLSLADLTSGQTTTGQTSQGLQMPATQGLQMQTQVTASPTTPSVQTNSATYTVKKGDTLWNISKKYYGDGRKWRVILAANISKVKSPKTLRIGISLVIPSLTTTPAQMQSSTGGLSTNSLSSQSAAQSQSINTQTQSAGTGQTNPAEQSDLDPG